MEFEDSTPDNRVNYVFDMDYYREHGFLSSEEGIEPLNGQQPILGLGAGDSYLLLNVLPPDLAEQAFHSLDSEINWNTMNHKGSEVPRLISIQGDVDENGNQPLYRHPADEQPVMVHWTPFSHLCRDLISQRIRQTLNHALIQKYRSGKDNIGEHSDKTLDISLNSSVVNLSIGASRVMILKPKSDYSNCDFVSPEMTLPSKIERPNHLSCGSSGNEKERIYHKITLPHNSVFVLGWKTNRDFLHSIRQDKRLATQKRSDELLNNETRISLTFREISTFINSNTGEISGQGALKRDRWNEVNGNESEVSEVREVSEAEQSVRMLNSFSRENRLSSEGFNWEEEYGCGFSIVNFKFLNERNESERQRMIDAMSTGVK